MLNYWLWSVLQHELYVERQSYGQLYMYGYHGNFLVCPKLVLLWSVSTWIYAKLKIHAKLKFYGQHTLKSMVNSKFMPNSPYTSCENAIYASTI